MHTKFASGFYRILLMLEEQQDLRMLESIPGSVECTLVGRDSCCLILPYPKMWSIFPFPFILSLPDASLFNLHPFLPASCFFFLCLPAS